MSNTIGPKAIMFVRSGIVKSEIVSSQMMEEWYCDEHIPEIIAVPGCTGAQRYKAIEPNSHPSEALTMYELEAFTFPESSEFKTVAFKKQTPEVEKIFQAASFDTRIYELVQGYEKSQEPGSLLLVSVNSYPDSEEFIKFYGEEHIPLISKLPGYVRSRSYRLCSRSMMSCLQPVEPPSRPQFLALHEFVGETYPWEGLKETQGTTWAKQIGAEMTDLEWGCYALTKDFRAEL